MGFFSNLFGGKEQPTYTPPAPPKLPTADELFASGTNYAKTNMPNAFGAREGALADLQNPMAYYGSFQPTSFEQALGNQAFQNIWPDQQAYMANVLGKSGMASSPVAATTLGNAYGNLATNIGQYLNTQANDRATGSLNARLGIDPNNVIQPFVNVGMNQGNAQANADYGYQQALAKQQYQQAMNKFQQEAATARMVGQISPVGGTIYGASTGHLGDAWGGSGQSFQQMLPMIMSMATGGAGGFGMSGGAGFGQTIGSGVGGYSSPQAMNVFQ